MFLLQQVVPSQQKPSDPQDTRTPAEKFIAGLDYYIPPITPPPASAAPPKPDFQPVVLVDKAYYLGPTNTTPTAPTASAVPAWVVPMLAGAVLAVGCILLGRYLGKRS